MDGELYFFDMNPEKRFDRFPEAEIRFYNSVKLAIALFSTIVGSYPHSYIQDWLSTNSTINGTGKVLADRMMWTGLSGQAIQILKSFQRFQSI